MSSERSFLIIITVLLFLFLASPASAFGAGYVAPGSHLKESRFRHGDIALAVPILATANRRLVKQIYFGNWLRDFSQLLDKGSIAHVPRPILSALVSVFAFLQFGYATREFEVTNERLRLYRPEEHIDNPKGYDDVELSRPAPSSGNQPREPEVGKVDDDGYGISQGLRPAVHSAELAIDSRTAMKNYIANTSEVGTINPTSAEFVEKQLIAAIACGRQGNEEAYIHLGAALHTLEDFTAHSNYVELAMQLVGAELQETNSGSFATALKDVFAFVGEAAKVGTQRGRAAPIVTGTFGALDLYQTLLGEIDDKLSAVSMPGLELRTPEGSGSLKPVAKQLIGVLNGLTPSFEKDILKIQKSTSENYVEPADWGTFESKPEVLWEMLKPIFTLRDDVVKWVEDHLTIKAVQEALATISEAIDKFVFTALGVVLSPILPELRKKLKDHELRLLHEDQRSRAEEGEQRIFDAGSTATNPTHSQLAKDHYDHPLNDLAGRVAVRISSYTISIIIQLWQPGNTMDPRAAIEDILGVFHHPNNTDKSDSSGVRTHMLDEVRAYVRECLESNPEAFEATLHSLSQPSMAARMDVHAGQPGGHTHVDSNRRTQARGTEYWKGTSIEDNPVAVKLCNSIERQIEQGQFKKFGMAEFPAFKEVLFASPSADSPNPLDSGLVKLPGLSFVNTFNEIDVNEIVTADGMGETLKDAVISLILLDDLRATHEEGVAAAKVGRWSGDASNHEAAARLRELRSLLVLKGSGPVQSDSKTNESKSGAAKEKLSAKVEKLKLKAF